jgi:phosphonate transport system permease protein
MIRIKQLKIKQLVAIVAFVLVFVMSIWYVELNIIELVMGIPTFVQFLFFDFFPPNLSDMQDYIKPFADSLIFSVIATCISSFIAMLIAFMMAFNTTPHPLLRTVFRGINSIFRNIPFLVWASVLVVIFGIGTLPGLITLIMFGISFLSRVYAESIEEIDKNVLEALDACGATYWQRLKHAVIPQFMPSFYSWTLFMFEISISASAVLGLVGAGGIGGVLKLTMDLFQYSKTSTIVAIMIGLILMVEFVTHRIRERLI